MKRILLIVACIMVITTTSKAQDSVVYKSVLGDSIAEWYDLFFMEDLSSGNTVPSIVLTNDYIKISDTVYYIYQPFQSAHYNVPDPYCFTELYDSTKYIRESDDNSKLYFRWAGQSSEMLIMDLNLKVGDTLDTRSWKWKINSYEYSYEYYYYIFDSIYNGPTIVVDSVYYHDGRKCIRTNYYITFEHHSGFYPPYTDTLKFMEGIGPSFGIMYVPITMLTKADWRYFKEILFCYFKDDTFEYHRETRHSCLIWWTIGIDEADDSKASLYPNPTKDKVFITNLVAEEHSIKIVSQMGTVVKTITAYGREIEIDLKELPNGVYNIVIVNSNGSMSKKIIKL